MASGRTLGKTLKQVNSLRINQLLEQKPPISQPFVASFHSSSVKHNDLAIAACISGMGLSAIGQYLKGAVDNDTVCIGRGLKMFGIVGGGLSAFGLYSMANSDAQRKLQYINTALDDLGFNNEQKDAIKIFLKIHKKIPNVSNHEKARIWLINTCEAIKQSAQNYDQLNIESLSEERLKEIMDSLRKFFPNVDGYERNHQFYQHFFSELCKTVLDKNKEYEAQQSQLISKAKL